MAPFRRKQATVIPIRGRKRLGKSRLVEHLRKAIREGRFVIDHEKIADGVINDIIQEGFN